jgi:phosphate:Na+ symporter
VNSFAVLLVSVTNAVKWDDQQWLWLVMGLIGGLGLFLLGMEMLSRSLKALAGRQMRLFLESATRNRLVAAVFGVLFTVLFQSSSASTVVLIGLVDAGLLSFVQTLPVVLGTAFGTTITAQLVAFKVGQYSLLAIGVGFLLSMASRGKWKSIFEVLLSLGILFYGMEIMSGAMKPLANYQPFIEIMSHISNPVIGLLVGLIATALIQSSAAFIGILITLGTTGLLSLHMALPLILGANIGTTVTGIISSLNAGNSAKKVAYVNLTFKLSTAILFLGLLPLWESFTMWSSQGLSLGRSLANAHTLFNLFLLIIWLPFTLWFGRWFDRVVLPTTKAPVFSLNHLTDNVLGSPDLSIALLKKELVDMGKVVGMMIESALDPFLHRDLNSIHALKVWEQETDNYREEINKFWLKSGHYKENEAGHKELFELFHLMNELEQIADLISVNLVQQAEKWQVLNIEFSEEGKQELLYYHSRCVKQFNRAILLVENRDYHRALKMKQKYRKYAYMAFDLELSHYKRLFKTDSQSVESSKIHLELLNLFRIINSRSTNFGRLIIMESQVPAGADSYNDFNADVAD